MLPVITGFIDELRAAGVPVSMVEAIDAMKAVEAIDIGSRVALRETLRATLVKNLRHERAFDTAFDVYFSTVAPPDPPESEIRGDTGSNGEIGEGTGAGGSSEMDQQQLFEALLDALAGMDSEALRRGVREAVERLAGMEPGRPVGGTYYLYRTLRRLDLEQMEAKLLEALTGDQSLSDFEERLLREEVEALIQRLREEIQEEIRRRLVADRGREAVAKTLRRPLIEDIDLMHATSNDLAEMEAAIGPLTRKLAARLARRRKKRTGRLDFRRTVRKSLATGGVPADPQFRHPRPHKPEVWLLCDISGSMATFSRFTLQFTHAMSTHFSRLRSFAFVDTIDEVTDFFGPGIDFNSAVQRITTEAEVVWLDGHSDYGNSMETFYSRYGSQLTPRTTVIITGDARNNYRPARDAVLGEVARTARALVWLNPEPRAYWDTGDSAMSQYGQHCTSVHEVRTLRQLEDFVETLTLPAGRAFQNV
ncbi:MAG TPA: VWA domain-containing protein [Acidimicrobiia bacterium]|nr:VWA domain-containing protein [Acidimicrobiia bacterium]